MFDLFLNVSQIGNPKHLAPCVILLTKKRDEFPFFKPLNEFKFFLFFFCLLKIQIFWIMHGPVFWTGWACHNERQEANLIGHVMNLLEMEERKKKSVGPSETTPLTFKIFIFMYFK